MYVCECNENHDITKRKSKGVKYENEKKNCLVYYLYRLSNPISFYISNKTHKPSICNVNKQKKYSS